MKLAPGQLPHRVTINRLRDETTRDRYNSRVRKPLGGKPLVTRARVMPRTSSEDTDSRDELRTEYLVIVPAGTDVRGVDTLTWEGVTLQVDGPPRPMPDGQGVHHIELDAFAVTG